MLHQHYHLYIYRTRIHASSRQRLLVARSGERWSIEIQGRGFNSQPEALELKSNLKPVKTCSNVSSVGLYQTKNVFYLWRRAHACTLETLDYTIRIGSTPTFLYFDFYEMAFFYKMAILYRMVIWIYFIDVRWIFRDMIQGLEGVGLTIPTTHIRHIL